MSKIRILPEILSNKIAAGEVVERPASVVKELIENALDAQSSKIIVEVESGGRSLIRISDNGHGMDHDDALLAIERYATSKIYTDEDLFSIRTLGFRGEALPSIASVSRFELVSKTQKKDTGIRIIIEGGKIKDVQQVGAPTGTMITVRQLFFNTPARRKFLKTVTTETGHIIDTIASIALGWPDVQFEFIHNKKSVKNWPVSINRLDRVLAVLGNDLHNQMHAISHEQSGINIGGWISSPMTTRSTSQKIYIFVNGRYIRDRGIQHALIEGYRGRLMKGRFPLAVLFINIPYDQLDVNVHPTKHEVRFAAYQAVYNILKQTVENTWQKIDPPKRQRTAFPRAVTETASKPVQQFTNPSIAEQQTTFKRTPSVKETFAETNTEPIPQKTPFPLPTPPPPQPVKSEKYPEAYPVQPKREETAPQALSNLTEKQAPAQPNHQQTALWTAGKYKDLKIIGQLHNTYLLCESENALVLIDQHAAHERILYEKFKTHSKTDRRPVSQRLLIPETIDLGYREAAILEKLTAEFNAVGFEIEPFGGHTFVIKAVPALLADKQIKDIILEVVEKIQEIGVNSDVTQIFDECLMIMACHGSLRARQRLSEMEIRALLDQLDSCDNSSHCPHGRPIRQKWSITTLEKSFKRIV